MVDSNAGKRQAQADADAHDLFATYEEQTPRSRALHERATAVMPGGDTRSVTYHRPYPSFITEAKDAWLETADGERLVNFLNNYTQSVLGHAPDAVVNAICERIRAGNEVAAPTEPAVELAERLVGRVPSVERIRFASSGTEATMNVVRAAVATFLGHSRRPTSSDGTRMPVIRERENALAVSAGSLSASRDKR